MKTGDIVENYELGPQIGQGAFGSIFAAKDIDTGLIYGFKTESVTAERKTLSFEHKVYVRIQDSPYFPKYFDSGEKDTYSWIIIEMIGPSLSSIIKATQSHVLSISTGLRVSHHALMALRSLHEHGFIHRDIKPGNILVRISDHDIPICLIDFGLVRVYRDQKTQQLLKKRDRTGFRGTKTYASLNAHMQQDLSRADDLISWFYFTVDILAGLPWKGVQGNTDVAVMKNNFNVHEALASTVPELAEIWVYLQTLTFESEPDYFLVESILLRIIHGRNIKEDDPYDWDSYLRKYKELLIADFGVALRIDNGRGPKVTMTDSMAQLMKDIQDKSSAVSQPLLRKHSVMPVSELNEQSDKCCC